MYVHTHVRVSVYPLHTSPILSWASSHDSPNNPLPRGTNSKDAPAPSNNKKPKEREKTPSRPQVSPSRDRTSHARGQARPDKTQDRQPDRPRTNNKPDDRRHHRPPRLPQPAPSIPPAQAPRLCSNLKSSSRIEGEQATRVRRARKGITKPLRCRSGEGEMTREGWCWSAARYLLKPVPGSPQFLSSVHRGQRLELLFRQTSQGWLGWVVGTWTERTFGTSQENGSPSCHSRNVKCF
ncbi:uncharacterized protein B0H64DRAFT_139886 [Chaetomium fimeti]|uniref:SH3 domain-containing protein n=1 Tax=Chaetomium fimeti TaxID=1854472 RepID=A0AAE0HEM7_9PEZI|nr:hypothetical protein B0H64DRAFT_139886 [Chaetomium fimeti]